LETISLASLVSDSSARAELETAEEHVRNGRFHEAIEAAAGAFDTLLGNFERRARGQSYRSPFRPVGAQQGSRAHFFRLDATRSRGQTDATRSLGQELERHFRDVWKAIDAIEESLRLVLLGLDFRQFTAYSAVAPGVYHTM